MDGEYVESSWPVNPGLHLKRLHIWIDHLEHLITLIGKLRCLFSLNPKILVFSSGSGDSGSRHWDSHCFL